MERKKLLEHYRYSLILLKQLVTTDFKLRYQGSVLGYAWSLLKPLLLFAILYVIFVKFLRIGGNIPHYPIYLLFGIVLWNFFSEITGQSLTSIVARGDLIRKIRIPRWIIVISSSISALINLGLNMIVIAVFMVFNKVELTPHILWLPIIIAEIYILGLGLSFFLAAAYVKYRDMSYIWDVVLQAFFYLTPILFPLSIVANENYRQILLLNPMAQAIQDGRNVLVTQETITIAEVYGTSMARIAMLVFVLVIFVFGLLYFKKEAKSFAENI